jgi:hypothetical protein
MVGHGHDGDDMFVCVCAEQFALTIRDTDDQGRPTVKHYKIKRLDDGGFYITTRRTFQSLRQLVDYYTGE